jgi:hypothetical protein
VSLPTDDFDVDAQWRMFRDAYESLAGRQDASAERQRAIILRDWMRFNERHGRTMQ